jgi:uncharacterized protein with PIN domain
MNDFTKEELYDLQSVCDVCNNPLMLKIQSMIDNYCEHKNKQFYELVDVDECKDCGLILI